MSDGTKGSLAKAGRWRYWSLFALCLLFSAIVLAPTLRTGFSADDAINSLNRPAAIAYHHNTVWGLAVGSTIGWVRTQGRFFPLSTYVLFLFDAVNGNLVLYKWICLILLLLNLALFGVFVRQLTGSRALGLTAIVLPTLFFQDATFYDPIIAFGALLQVDFALTVSALLLFLLYVRKRRTRDLWLSVALYVAALMTYEIIAPLVLLFPLAALVYGRRRSVKDALRMSWPFLLAVCLAVVTTFSFRIAFRAPLVSHGSGSSPYSFSLAPLAVGTALAKQVIAALPLIFAALHHANATVALHLNFASPVEYVSRFPVTTLMIFAGYLALILLTLREATHRLNEDARPVHLAILVWFGLALWVLPALLISLSPRWQRELWWGVGYLPVYLEYFGVALLALAGIYAALRAVWEPTARMTLIVLFAIVCAGIGAINFQDNRIVLEFNSRNGGDYTRQTAERAVARGILSKLPPGTPLYSEKQLSFQCPDFFLLNCGRYVPSVEPVQSISTTEAMQMSGATTSGPDGTFHLPPGKQLWVIDYYGPSLDAGTAVIGRAETLNFQDGKLVSAGLRAVEAYVENPTAQPPGPDSLMGSPLPTASAASLDSLGIDPQSQTLVSSGPSWSLYTIETPTATP